MTASPDTSRQSTSSNWPVQDRSPSAQTSVDKSLFFALMAAFPTGVTVVTTLDAAGRPRGLTSNAVCSVSADPPLVLVCIDKRSHTLPALQYRKAFVVNYLLAGRDELSNLFASKGEDKFVHVAWKQSSIGMPWLHRDCIAHAECVTEQELEAGDHVILVARVVGGEPAVSGTRPLMYYRRSYSAWPEIS